jgi:hypothetical protein
MVAPIISQADGRKMRCNTCFAHAMFFWRIWMFDEDQVYIPLNKENPGMNRQDLSYRGFLGESMTFGRLNEHTHPEIYTNNVPHLSNFRKINHLLTRTAKAFYL